MERQAKILDASVIVKWFAEEISTDKALKLKEEYLSEKIDIIIPEFAFLEVLNSLRYKKNNERGLLKISKDLFNIDFKVEKINEIILNKAVSISMQYNITIYDSVYIALSQIYGCPLITADKELYNIPNIIPLEKYD